MATKTKTEEAPIVYSEVKEVTKPAHKKAKTAVNKTIRSKKDILASIMETPKDDSKVDMPTPDTKTKTLATIVDTGQIDLSSLSEDDKHELIAIGSKLNVHDISTVTNFGSELQKAMNDTSKALLSTSRTSKVGSETEAILKEMMSKISEIDISEIKAPNKIERVLRRIPIINKLFNSVEKFMAKYEEQLYVPYVLHSNDLKVEDGIVYLPLYMTPLL